MRINVQLLPDAAAAFHANRLADLTQHLVALVNRYKGKISPVHPGQTHPLLLPHFTIELPNQADAKAFLSELQQLSAVSSAYISPDPELS
jgi:hypothetical protein